MNMDKELAVMKRINTLLQGLDEKARERVVMYFMDRWATETNAELEKTGPNPEQE